jgi:hypothetical protein
MAGSLKKAGPFGGIMAELMAEDAQSPGRVGEAAGDFRSWALLDEVSAERFVLALEGGVWGEEELGLGAVS